MKSIRFWHYHNGAVQIRIAAGETLRHFSSGETDEGWSSELNEWTFDGETLTARWKTDGRDCDGRMIRHGESSCPADKVKAGFRDEDGLAFPAWQDGKSGQRDFSAEAMGY
jgi:hypothetical protein